MVTKNKNVETENHEEGSKNSSNIYLFTYVDDSLGDLEWK